MYSIYIKNYLDQNGTYQTEEKLLYSIPMNLGEPNAFIDPKVVGDMGKAGTFEFQMNVHHPYYNSLCLTKTIFRVDYDGDTIFYGRVLTIDVGHLTGNKSVHCEGALAFLLDSQIEGVVDSKRSKTNALTYMRKLINAHNRQMNEGDSAFKKMVLGEVPGQYSSAIQADQKVNPDSSYLYGSGSWRDTQNAFTELADSFGGFIRARYQNGTIYLDWLDGYYRANVNEQKIELGKNLIDITSNNEVNNIFTALIPVGSSNGKNIYIDGYKTDIHGNNKRILVPQITQVYTDAQLNRGVHTKEDYQKAVDTYGIIYKVESFSNANTKAKLWAYACDWIKNNYIGGLSSFDVSALDMHLIGNSNGKFLVGDKVTIVYPDVDKLASEPSAMMDKTMTMTSITYDLYHPEKNQYKISIPNAILKKKYGVKKKNAKSSAKSPKTPDGDDTPRNASWKTYEDFLIWQFVQDNAHDSGVYKAYKEKYGEEASDAILYTAWLTIGNALNSDDPDSLGNKMAKMVIDGHNGKLQFKAVSGPIDQQVIRDAGEALDSLVLDGQAGQLLMNRKWPAEAAQWTPEMRFQYDRQALFIDAANNGATMKLFASKGETASSTGKNLLTTALDAAKGAIDGSAVNLAGSLEDVQKVVDQEALANLGLNGVGAQISGGDGEQNYFNIFGNVPQAGTGTPTSGFSFSKYLEHEGEKGTAKTINATGDNGLVGMVSGYFGGNKQDGVEGVIGGTEDPTIKMDGENATIEAGTGTAGSDPTYKVDGKVGKEWVGRKQDGSWQIKLNDTVTYEDEDGQTQTAGGFVSAADFNIPSIPSFKTKLGVFDRVIAGKVDAYELNAVKARIDNITGDTIVADTVVRSAHIYGGDISGSTVVGTGRVAGSEVVGSKIGFADGDDVSWIGTKIVKIGNTTLTDLYLYGGGNGNTLTIPNAVTGFGEYSEVSGEIQIPYYTYDSGPSTQAGTINFNIADTRTYKNGVSAALRNVTMTDAGWRFDEDNGYQSMITNSANSRVVYVGLPTITLEASANWSSAHKKTVNAYGPNKSGIVATSLEIDASSVYSDGVADGKPTAITRTGYSTDDKTVTVKASRGSTDLLTDKVVSATEIYNAGWAEAAYNVSMPSTESTSASSITVSYPNASNPDGALLSRSYALSADDDYVYLKTSGTTVARIANPKQGGSDGGLSAIAISSGHSSYDMDDSSLANTPIPNAGTLERNKYYRVVATANNGDRFGLRFKTAANAGIRPSISCSSFTSGNATSPIRTLSLSNGAHGFVQITATSGSTSKSEFVQINVG